VLGPCLKGNFYSTGAMFKGNDDPASQAPAAHGFSRNHCLLYALGTAVGTLFDIFET
jgi:hypothetical protein